MGRKKKSARYKGHTGDLLVGRLFTNRNGSGFVIAGQREYFIAAKHLNGAMHGDTVALRPLRTYREGRAGTVVRVLERAHSQIIGQYHALGPLGVVVPRDKHLTIDVFVEQNDTLTAQEGDWVCATIVAYPSRHQSLQAVITRIISRAAEKASIPPESVILASNDIEEGFDDAALTEARDLRFPTDEELVTDPLRRDITQREVFTIDPFDARDFDDAISIEFLDKGLTRLGVHIADVAHFVAPHSALDRSARRKSTSTYLPSRVIPMLPEELSQDLCSLNPGVRRLAMSVDIVFNEAGEQLSFDIYPSIIRSTNRYTYDEVLSMLEGSLPFRSESQERMLRALDALAMRLSKRREERGGLDFTTQEPKVRLDKEGAPIEIVMRTKTRATQMIEEAMLLANEIVATYLHRRKVASVYRVHEKPNADALDSVVEPLREFGYRLPSNLEVTPRVFQNILSASKGNPEEYFVSTLLLKTLKQAYYAPTPLGHFGLASEYYTHFTSPIRRYPDLMVHRILKAVLSNDKDALEVATQDLEPICHHCSVGERNAQDAEREAIRYKVCEYMQSKIGEEFEGIISNVSHFGLFVTLDNSAEGLVHKKNFDEHEMWAFSSTRHMFVNEKRTKQYRLGQPICVVLISVDIEQGLLDFRIKGQ